MNPPDIGPSIAFVSPKGADPAMTRSRYSPPRLLVMAAAFATVSAASSLPAQVGMPGHGVKLKEPVASRVYQRDVNGRAEIPIILEEGPDAKVIDATVNGPNMGSGTIKFVDGKLVGVPAGGPYTINCRVEVSRVDANRGVTQSVTNTSVGPVFVGDLWVLAGQSNMEGVGDLIDVTPPHPRVMMLGMDGKWKPAEEPLHWLVDSPDPVHSGDPKTRAQRSAQTHKNRTQGRRPGLAVRRGAGPRRPASRSAWSPAPTAAPAWSSGTRPRKRRGARASMARCCGRSSSPAARSRACSGIRARATPTGEACEVYSQVFARLHRARSAPTSASPSCRSTTSRSAGSSVRGDPKGWNTVQEAQRLLAERVPNTAVISVIDLELDDGIHVGTQGLKRAGQRLARIAERELFGQIGATTPTFDRVTKGPHNTLVVKFKGVNMGGAGGPARMPPMTG